MKSKKLLIFLAAILAFALIVPANAEYEPVRQDRRLNQCDDHPWGGDSDTADPIIGGRVIIPSLIGTPVHFINVINIIVISRDRNQNNGSGNDMLPDNFGGGNGNNHGNRKG